MCICDGLEARWVLCDGERFVVDGIFKVNGHVKVYYAFMGKLRLVVQTCVWRRVRCVQ